VSSVLDGAASVVSLDGELDLLVPDGDVAEVELLVADPGELVVLLLNVQPDISIAATTIAAPNHRWVMQAS
jgi:hypothetical protein